ncbi:MAG: hypothetical protein HON43_03610 [Alphaproteobacteria bacterium]|jgi:quinol monooxygenase YgiN|nr:hypothetical protein [Alphaproteobacteria bacterium]MBT5389270.1 hypothetical protein [Alphaproteobacteria bacterium]
MKNTLTCIVRFLAKEGKVTELTNQFEQLLSLVREKESGCVKSSLLSNKNNSQEVCLMLNFTNYEEYRKHFTTDYLKEFVENHVPNLVEKIDQELYSPIQ